MLKFLFNIVIVYALWQLFKMVFTVNKAQKHFQEKFKDLNEKVNSTNTASHASRKSSGKEGEYIDYEEIKD